MESTDIWFWNMESISPYGSGKNYKCSSAARSICLQTITSNWMSEQIFYQFYQCLFGAVFSLLCQLPAGWLDRPAAHGHVYIWQLSSHLNPANTFSGHVWMSPMILPVDHPRLFCTVHRHSCSRSASSTPSDPVGKAGLYGNCRQTTMSRTNYGD